MKVAIIGSGGREHSICYKLKQSKNLKKLVCIPGNAGTANEDKVTNIEISADDINALKTFAKKEEIELTIVGPEAPLVDGIVDFLEKTVAIDFEGNIFEFSNKDCKRWVIFNGKIEATKVPPHWHAWLHKTIEDPPLNYSHKYFWYYFESLM